MLLYFIWLLPLLGGVLLWAFGPQLKSWAGPIGSALIGVVLIAGDEDPTTGVARRRKRPGAREPIVKREPTIR